MVQRPVIYLLLTAVLIVSALVLGYSVGRFSTPTKQVTTTVSNNTSTITSTTTITANVPDEGYISFLNIGNFAYKRVALGEGESITFKGVTFTNLRLNTTYTGCSVSFIKTSFQDKVSEVKQITICPTLFEPHMYFTNHTNPKAGVIVSFGHSPIIQGTYILVED